MSSVRASELVWPEITPETKPWSRWWWLGNILDETSLRSEMQKYADAGLGGLEITPIYGVRGYEDQFLNYLSPEFMARLVFVLEEAKQFGLGIDMATGNGWPFGGPWVEADTACKYLAHRTWSLAGGARLAEPVRLVERPIVRVAGPRRVALDELVEPISANANLQDLALDQVRFEKPLPLVALAACASDGRWENLTSRVAADGTLDWTAPAGGTWKLYALFQGWHGKQVERAGPGGEGNVTDHFSVDALRHYLSRFDDAFARAGGTHGLRGFFNDSYEVDDAFGNADWTPGFFDEFRVRRGYDLLAELPALFGESDADRCARVATDYREMISDLLLERFTVPWRQWAHGYGAIIRNQAHGSPANILDLYAASDIPEQEGADVIAMKLASSAAHVTGKRLASAETATWINEHFLGTLGEVKAAVDRFFLGGINHNCYHGTAFSPPDPAGAGWPGFHFYASIELNPSNPIWRDFPVLNGYVTRAQSFLQLGAPDEDVLLYYNIHDRWSQRGDGALPHFHGREREGTTTWREAAQALLAAGIGFDNVSDRLLEEVHFVDGALRPFGASSHPVDAREVPAEKVARRGSGGTSLANVPGLPARATEAIAPPLPDRYRAIVVPHTKQIPLETMTRLFELAQAGATIVLHRAMPADVPGLGRLNARRSEFQVFAEALRRSGETRGGVVTLPWGRGRVFVGDDLRALLEQAGVEREPLVDLDLGFVRRRSDEGTHYFLLNRGAKRVEAWVPLRTGGRSVVLFDPMSGAIGRAAARSAPAGGIEVYLQLDPGASIVARVGASSSEGPAWSYWRDHAAGTTTTVTGPWTVSFIAGGPELSPVSEINAPASWTEFAGEAGKIFAGTAVYRASFDWSLPASHGVRIDLGSVAESARVRINGREVAALLSAPYRVHVPASLLQAHNTIEVEVTNLAANRIADLDRRGVRWKKFYNTNMPARRGENRGTDGLFTAAHWSPRPSGLLGPVVLAPVERFDPLVP